MLNFNMRNKIAAMYAVYNQDCKNMAWYWENSFMDDAPVYLFYCDSIVCRDIHCRDGRKLIDFRLDKQIFTINQNMGKIIIWSDVDLVFLQKVSLHILNALNNADICGIQEQAGTTKINGGFVAMRCTPQVLELYKTVRDTPKDKFHLYEQDLINQLLATSTDVKLQLLPKTFQCHHMRSHYDGPLVVYHATIKTEQKLPKMIEVLRAHKRVLLGEKIF